MKFPELTPSALKKNLKLACCDRCNRAEWVEPNAQVSFCGRCSTRRRAPTKPELEQFRQITVAAVRNTFGEKGGGQGTGESGDGSV